MKKASRHVNKRFDVDLTRIRGEGELPCLSCGEIISPDDESGLVYDVLGFKKGDNDSIESAVILCKKGRNTIKLNGFKMLEEIGCSEKLPGVDDSLNFITDLVASYYSSFFQNLIADKGSICTI